MCVLSGVKLNVIVLTIVYIFSPLWIADMNSLDLASSDTAVPAPILPGQFFDLGSQVLQDTFRNARPDADDSGKLLADGFSCLRWLNRYQHLWPPFASNHTVQINAPIGHTTLVRFAFHSFNLCFALLGPCVYHRR